MFTDMLKEQFVTESGMKKSFGFERGFQSTSVCAIEPQHLHNINNNYHIRVCVHVLLIVVYLFVTID